MTGHGIPKDALSSVVIAAPVTAGHGAVGTAGAEVAFHVLADDLRGGLYIVDVDKRWQTLAHHRIATTAEKDDDANIGSRSIFEGQCHASRLLLLRQSPGFAVGISSSRITVWDFNKRQRTYSCDWGTCSPSLSAGGSLQFAAALMLPLPQSISADTSAGDCGEPIELVLYNDANGQRTGIIALTSKRFVGEAMDFGPRREQEISSDTGHRQRCEEDDVAAVGRSDDDAMISPVGPVVTRCCVSGYGTPALLYDNNELTYFNPVCSSSAAREQSIGNLRGHKVKHLAGTANGVILAISEGLVVEVKMRR